MYRLAKEIDTAQVDGQHGIKVILGDHFDGFTAIHHCTVYQHIQTSQGRVGIAHQLAAGIHI